MAKKEVMKLGTTKTWEYSVALDEWEAGGTFYFAAKTAADTDNSDTSAAVKKEFNDDYIQETTATTVDYVLPLDPSDTYNATEGTYLAAFKYVSASGAVTEYETFKFILQPLINRRPAP